MATPIILPLQISGTSIRFSGVGHESRFQGIRGPVKCSQLAQNIMNRANPIIVPLPTYGTSMGAFTFRFSGVGHKSRSRGGRFKCSSLNSDVEKLRQEFLEVLGRNRIPVTLTVEPKPAPVIDPNVLVTSCQVKCKVALDSRCISLAYPFPRRAMSEGTEVNLKDQLVEEHFYLHTEDSKQGKLPVLIMSMKERCKSKKPAIVFMHSTATCKDWWRPFLERYASRGYLAVAIDSRYHGERAESNQPTYDDALVSAWKNGNTMPFIYDTVWDLIKLADYLTQQRDDVDSARIGIMGISLGAMHSWFAAFADTRYAVAVPIIGVQGFQWAIDNDQWQARVDSIKPVFEAARVDLGKDEIDSEVVGKVWDRIAPGLRSDFDAPNSVPAIAPRPLLIMNGEDDPRCPIRGLDIPVSNAKKTYKEVGYSDKFKFISELGVGHNITASMMEEASKWFDRFLYR